MPRTIGFIGLGIMGLSMAKRLIEAGHKVTVYNRTASKAAPLVALGAKKAATPREAAKGNEIVISIVTDSPDVEEVLLGKDGAVHAAEKNALFIDMTTIAPDTARSIGQDEAKKLGLPLQGTALAQKLFEDNQKSGEGKLGTQAMYKAVERRIKN